MTHERDPTSLWRSAEESNSELSVSDILDVFRDSSPCRLSHRLLVVIKRRQFDPPGSIYLYFFPVAYGKARLLRRPKVPGTKGQF